MIKISNKERIKITDLCKKVAQKIYDSYRDDPNPKFYTNEFYNVIIEDIPDILKNDYKNLLRYMQEKKYIIFKQDGISLPEYFIPTANLIDFVEK